MNADERVVEDCLKSRGYTDIVYEPDGNIPPDFLVNGNIAIEVRRLNQNRSNGAIAEGLEKVAIPLWGKVKKLLNTMGPPVEGESWLIHFRFTRPVEPWKTLERKLVAGLKTFSDSRGKVPAVVATGQGFELEIIARAPYLATTMFVMAGCSDEESGGWLLGEMESNINYCVSEKSRKIEKMREKYEHWWLALVDHIGYGLDDFDQEMFRDQASIQHNWENIILIDPRDPHRWFEI